MHLRLQIPQQPLKRPLVAVVVLPVGEIGDEVFADLTGGILAGIGVKRLPLLDSLVRDKADGKERLALFSDLPLTGVRNFCLHPFTAHAGVGENYKKPVMDSDGFVNLFVDLFAALNVMWGKPTTNATALEVSI